MYNIDKWQNVKLYNKETWNDYKLYKTYKINQLIQWYETDITLDTLIIYLLIFKYTIYIFHQNSIR